MTKDNINFQLLAEEVIKRTDIVVEAEREGLHLIKRGRNYFALCIFHPDSDPSLSISPQKQIFRCFSCGKGGNVISLIASLRGVSKGKIIYEYAKVYGLIGNGKMSRAQQKEIQQRVIKHEFKKKEESNFDEVYQFLCDMVRAYRKVMKQVKNMDEVILLQDHYQLYDRLPYYEYLLDCMIGDGGEVAQVEAYLRGEELMHEWDFRVNN